MPPRRTKSKKKKSGATKTPTKNRAARFPGSTQIVDSPVLAEPQSQITENENVASPSVDDTQNNQIEQELNLDVPSEALEKKAIKESSTWRDYS